MEENDDMSEKENDQYDDYWTEDMLNKELENDNDKVRAIYGIKSKDKALVTKRAQPNSKEVEAMKAIEKELGQMLSKKVWHPVHMHQLTSDEKKNIIRSSLFLKEKYDASGKFEKIKARLVAGGHMQDRSIYPDLSAPTAAISSVFAIAAIAAHENRGVHTIDITGAYLNADMHKTGIDVYMKIDGQNAKILCQLDNNYKRYMQKGERGEYLVVNLDRALYGCVESAKLWYNDLKETLDKAGYKVNSRDECVFNKGSGDEQCTIVLHVDDMMITSRNKKMRTDLIEALRARYTEGLSVHEGPVISYLGMTFDWRTRGEVRISQCGYINDVLGECGIDGESRSPASMNLFETRQESPTLDNNEKEYFHRQVAKLLYLAKRTKPECLTAVAYLTTRVTKSNLDDMVKLGKLLKYIRKTKDSGIVLRPGELGLQVRCYIDAAYGVHDNGKSVTGSVVVIGEAGPLHAKSSKQKIVTKSSTEAELVAASDSANQALFIREFLMEQGYKMKPVTIYQDNLSCMALISKGRPSSERTRHMSIRNFWIKDKVVDGDVVIEHLGTKDMFANLLTKPLQGAQFVRERDMLTNWKITEEKEDNHDTKDNVE
jgi:hypothetical protein